MDLDGGQRAVPSGAELHPRGHLMARGRADELFGASEFPLHRSACLQCGQHAQILGDHLLLAAEATADALGEDMQVARPQAENVAEFLMGDEGRLGAGADMHPPLIAAPSDGAMRLEMHVLYAGGGISPLVQHRPWQSRPPRCRPRPRYRHRCCRFSLAALVVQHRRIRRHRRDRIENRRQDLVARPAKPASGLGSAFGFGYHGRHTLAGEAHHIVEDIGVVWIDEMILVVAVL